MDVLLEGRTAQTLATLQEGLQSRQLPIPAALPLFASGIGGLGFMAWRRKRKARAFA